MYIIIGGLNVSVLSENCKLTKFTPCQYFILYDTVTASKCLPTGIYMVSHVHREVKSSTRPINVNATRLCKKTGAVYQSLDNDETQFTKSADITASNNIVTSSIQENTTPEINDTKTTT